MAERWRDGLEFHHRRPYGVGGDHDLENVCLMCRTHNRYLANVDYGEGAGSRRPIRQSRSAVASP
jgi:hypothetical protein